MTKLMMKVFTLLFVMNSFVLLPAMADDIANPSAGAPTTATTPMPPKKKHHRKKVKNPAEANTKAIVPTSPAVSHTKPVPGTEAPSGMSDSLGANNPGVPNMGTADHTPGTTGTSGQ